MGLPISTILAEMVMQDFKTNALDKLGFQLFVYFRYIDDIFLIFPNDEIDFIISKFNSYHTRLQFTYETKNYRSVRFITNNILKMTIIVLLLIGIEKRHISEDFLICCVITLSNIKHKLLQTFLILFSFFLLCHSTSII